MWTPFFALYVAFVIVSTIFGSIEMHRNRHSTQNTMPMSIGFVIFSILLIILGRAYAPEFFVHFSKWAEGAALIGFVICVAAGGNFKAEAI